MVPGCQFGNHATIAGMQCDLAVQGMAQQAAAGVIQCHPGLIAGGFDTKHNHGLYSNPQFLLHKEILPFSRDVYRIRTPY